MEAVAPELSFVVEHPYAGTQRLVAYPAGPDPGPHRLPLGYVEVDLECDDDADEPPTCFIGHIEVAVGQRRRGVATALLAEVARRWPHSPLSWGQTTTAGTALRRAWESGHPR